MATGKEYITQRFEKLGWNAESHLNPREILTLRQKIYSSTDEYEKNADSIMEAIRSGNFVYDISGNAR